MSLPAGHGARAIRVLPSGTAVKPCFGKYKDLPVCRMVWLLSSTCSRKVCSFVYFLEITATMTIFFFFFEICYFWLFCFLGINYSWFFFVFLIISFLSFSILIIIILKKVCPPFLSLFLSSFSLCLSVCMVWLPTILHILHPTFIKNFPVFYGSVFLFGCIPSIPSATIFFVSVGFRHGFRWLSPFVNLSLLKDLDC